MESQGRIRGVLFDLDGTLLDTAHDMMNALNALRAEERLVPLSYEKVRCQVSHGANALVRLSFGELSVTEHEVMRQRLLTSIAGSSPPTPACSKAAMKCCPTSSGAGCTGAS